MRTLCAALGAALFLCTPLAAQAEDVTLTSRDEAVVLSGNLLGFDGEFYRVETAYGILTVDGSGVTCEGPGCPNLSGFVSEFSFSGAYEIGAVLMPALIEGFALSEGYAAAREELPDGHLLYRLLGKDGQSEVARITIGRSTSAEGFADLVAEETDIVMSLREVTATERRRTREAGLGDFSGLRQVRVVALDALVPVVSASNPVQEMSLETLAGVYSGKLTRWSDLGTEDAPITAYLRAPDAGFGHVFVREVLEKTESILAEKVVSHDTNAGVVNAVSQDPFGIGIASFARPGLTDALALTGECGFRLSATQGTIKAGDYPLTAPMYLYLPERRLPAIGRDFLAFLRRDGAQRIIRRIGLVDQSLSTIPVDAQGARLSNAISAAGPEVKLEELQRMVRLFEGHERLSLTFRFKDGSLALDVPSRSNVALLAEALETGKLDGKSLVFVGFSDGNGTAAQNLKLSVSRAKTVRDAVLREAVSYSPDRVGIATDGFGETLPMACDDSAWGRQINRRVEVWLK